MIRLDRQEAVAVVTIDRPETLNALNRAVLTDLHHRLDELARDDTVRVLVLTGAGERAFAAGADIEEMAAMDVAQARAWGELGQRVASLIETMPKPAIAAVNGFALGGGCELALACDIRYASTAARLGQPEVGIGIIPGWGGTQRLARVVGLGAAKELVLSGRMVEADEALRLGLVSAVFPPAELMPKTLELARELAGKSALALAAAKRMLNRALQGSLDAGLADEAAAFAELFGSEGQREGMAAFLERRRPRPGGR